MTLSLGIDRYREVVVLTGAGISVASGLRPYRGPGGLWEEAGVAELATAESMAQRPADVWKLFGPVRRQARAANPNAAHSALAETERRLSAAAFTIITQNIDGLHQRAGSSNVVELHGSIFRTRCTDPACDLEPFDDEDPHVGELPRCPRCSSTLRPDIVFFDEPLPGGAEWRAKRALRDCDFFMVKSIVMAVDGNTFADSSAHDGGTVSHTHPPPSSCHRRKPSQTLGRAGSCLRTSTP